jgi:hypothetical protein
MKTKTNIQNMKKRVIISNVSLYFSYLIVAGMGIIACLSIIGLFLNVVNSILS